MSNVVKLYTAYFPRPEDLPPDLRDPEFQVGDLKLVDGIVVSTKIKGITVGQPSGAESGLPLSSTRPPEIVWGHVLSGELVCENQVQVLAISLANPARRLNEMPIPILLRVNSFCLKDSQISGFVNVLSGPVEFVLKGNGIARSLAGHRIFWQDVLLRIRVGAELHIRPAGTTEVRDYVVRYTSTGINFLTLEQFHDID